MAPDQVKRATLNVQSLLLGSAAVGIGLIGIGYLISPRAMFGLYGIALSGVNEPNMVRAAYGGTFLAFSLLFGIGAYRGDVSYPALLALMTFMTGFAIGRIASLLIDGMPSLLIQAHILLEIGYAAAAGCLLFRGRAGSGLTARLVATAHSAIKCRRG